MFESLIDGLLFGFGYSLIGIGFTLIFGLMEKFNLAYGPTAIAGAYLGLGLHRLTDQGVPSYGLFVAAVIGAGMIGWLVYQVCFRFMPKEYGLAPLMSSMGMLILIEEVISHLTDAQPFEFPNPLLNGAFEITEDLFLRHDYLLLAVMALAVLGLLYSLIFHTPLGLATRAISRQPVAAQLCGATIERVNTFVFVFASAIGWATGFLIALTIGTVDGFPADNIPLLPKIEERKLKTITKRLYLYFNINPERIIYINLFAGTECHTVQDSAASGFVVETGLGVLFQSIT